MTAREKKAVELARKWNPSRYAIQDTDEAIRNGVYYLLALEAMEWQAEQCYRETHTCYEDKTVNSHNATLTRILNAGTEEATQ